MTNIWPAKLIPLNIFESIANIRIDSIYAQPDHYENIFKEPLYHPDALLSLDVEMAKVVLLAADILKAAKGWRLRVTDGLRPIEAQAAMRETKVVKEHLYWLEEPQMLSNPGQGGHPRGFAVDVAPELPDGTPIDMGTKVDEMFEAGAENRAARDYTKISPEIIGNRALLEAVMQQAATKLDFPLFPLPQEWWDYRIPADLSNQRDAFSEKHLPGYLRVMDYRPPTSADIAAMEKDAQKIMEDLRKL
ncbi:MAG: D-Ala-D-Ala dipeptidase [Alphaproteobacteria bacterium]|nr:D-Ala-D-Ala dipeptidase [Alphaproteobacteria bacterium]